MSDADKPLPTDETDLKWAVTGTTPGGEPWKRKGVGRPGLQVTLQEVKDSGLRRVKIELDRTSPPRLCPSCQDEMDETQTERLCRSCLADRGE